MMTSHIAGVVPRKGKGFATSVSMSKLVPGESLLPGSKISLFDPDPGVTAALAYAAAHADAAAVEKARQRGSDAWLAKNFAASATAYGELAALLTKGGAERATALRLRGAALLRAKQYEEAIADAQAALASLGQPEADPKTDKEFFDLAALAAMRELTISPEALSSWHLHGGRTFHGLPLAFHWPSMTFRDLP